MTNYHGSGSEAGADSWMGDREDHVVQQIQQIPALPSSSAATFFFPTNPPFSTTTSTATRLRGYPGLHLLPPTSALYVDTGTTRTDTYAADRKGTSPVLSPYRRPDSSNLQYLSERHLLEQERLGSSCVQYAPRFSSYQRRPDTPDGHCDPLPIPIVKDQRFETLLARLDSFPFGGQQKFDISNVQPLEQRFDSAQAHPVDQRRFESPNSHLLEQSLEQRRPDSPGGHHVAFPAPEHQRPDPQGVRYASPFPFPPEQRKRPPVAFFPPESPKRSATVTSLPLRSPKRTISFDFPNDMDPRKLQEIQRQIVQMAQEAGTSSSVKIVEGCQEEEEPIPIIRLQDPPKPKFKRQLSADNSPPSKQSAAAAAAAAAITPASTRGNEHPQQGLLIPSASRPSARAPNETSLVHPIEASSHYTSSNMSPKRLKSEHGSVPCTPPRSPLVKQLTTQVAETTLDRRGAGQLNSKPKATKRSSQTDVVHIFPQLGEETSDNNNNSAGGNNTTDLDISPVNRQERDETDSRQKSQGNKYSSGVVSVLNPQQPKRTEATQRVSSPVPVPRSALKPQESIETLQMLFKRKDESAAPRNEQSPSTNKASDLKQEESNSDRQSVASDMESEPPPPEKVNILASSGSNSRNINRVEVTNVEAANNSVMQSDTEKVPSASSQSSVLPLSSSPVSRASTATKNNEDILTDSDPYMAQLAGCLEDMQRRIFSQHQLSSRAVYTDKMSAQTGDSSSSGHNSTALSGDLVKEMGTVSGPNQTVEKVRENTRVTSVSDMSSTVPSTSVANSAFPAEEESRTARLCRSKTNPFSFSSRDIEKAQAVLSSPELNTRSITHTGQEGKELAVSRPESSPSKADGNFRLGELWINSTSEGQINALMKQRQFSDPGTFHPNPIPKPVLEKVKPTTTRQFSEPAIPHDQARIQDSSEFQKNPKQPGKSLQQQFRLRSETSEGSDVTEGHTAFFVGEEIKGASNVVRRNCPTSQGQVSSQGLLRRSPIEHFEASRNYPPFVDTSKCEGNFSRSQGDPFRRSYHKLTPPRPSPSENSAVSNWVQQQTRSLEDRTPASLRQTLEDDSVFEEVSAPDRGSPFKNPAAPVGYGDIFMGRSADRSSSSLRSDDLTPKRPALRSQSNVEQSPNKAELEAMAHYKYLRSFSEHISDPKRLMEQLRAMQPADCEQLMEQLQSMRRIGASASFSSEKELERPVNWNDRHRGARRILFQDEMASGGYDTAEWQQQGCYTYPPPLARRQSFCSARDLRRSLSSIRDRDSASFSGVTRSRQPGDIDVTLECIQATPASVHHQYYNDTTRTAQHPEILRMKIETYIHQILENHLQIRPSSNSQADMDLWIAQAAEIERLTQEASQLIETLSEHNRSVYDVMTGSVVIKVNCSTLLGVHDLWEKFESGVLQSLVGTIFGGEKMTEVTGLKDVEIKVSVCYLQYKTCLEELGAHLVEESPVTSPRNSKSNCRGQKEKDDQDKPNNESEGTGSHLVTPPWSPHCGVTSFGTQDLLSSPARASPTYASRSPSNPSKRQGKFTYGDCPARKAFSELNLSDGELTPTSPTSKKFFDSFNKEHSKLSPMTSPRVLHSPTTRGRPSHSDATNENYETAT